MAKLAGLETEILDVMLSDYIATYSVWKNIYKITNNTPDIPMTSINKSSHTIIKIKIDGKWYATDIVAASGSTDDSDEKNKKRY